MRYLLLVVIVFCGCKCNAQTKYDTVKVYMLLTDSTRGVLGLPKCTVAYSEYGYEVLKFVPHHWNNFDNEVYDNWEHYQYLDEKKRKLNKNIIVWLIK